MLVAIGILSIIALLWFRIHNLGIELNDLRLEFLRFKDVDFHMEVAKSVEQYRDHEDRLNDR